MTDFYFDQTGKWGGENAVIHRKEDKFQIYLLVGDYYNVGLWPDDYAPSQWDTVEKCRNFTSNPSVTGFFSTVVILIRFIIRKKKLYHVFMDTKWLLKNWKQSVWNSKK